MRAGEGYKAVVRYEGEAVYPDHDGGQLESRPGQQRITDALFSEVYRDSAREGRVRKQRKLADLDLAVAPSQNIISPSGSTPVNRNLPVRRKQDNHFPTPRRKLKKSLLIKKVRVPVRPPVLPKYVKKAEPEKVFEIPINIVEENVKIIAEQITNSTQTTDQTTDQTTPEESDIEKEENISTTESPLKPNVETETIGEISEFDKLKEIEEIGNTVTDEYDEDYFEDYYIFPFGSRLTSVILNPSSESGPASGEVGQEGDQEERIDPVHPGSPQPVRFVKTLNNTFVPEFYTS